MIFFFGKKGLEYSWFWFRIEYQERGTAHAHGYLRLKEDPGISELTQKVLKGRISEHKLKILGIIDDADSNEIINNKFL